MQAARIGGEVGRKDLETGGLRRWGLVVVLESCLACDDVRVLFVC